MMHEIFWPIRILLFYVCITITAILTFIVAAIFLPLPIPYKAKYAIIRCWTITFIFFAKVICGLNYEIKGLENIPKNACVIMINHQSMWETIAMPVLLPPQCWILKKELLRIPFFGWGLVLLKPISIDRKNINSVKQLIAQGIMRLKDNIFVIIYPEGTRIKVNETKAFSRSGAALAKAANTIILPIAHNAGKFWPRGIFPKHPGTIKIIIGKPIATADKDISEITKTVEAWINEEKSKIVG